MKILLDKRWQYRLFEEESKYQLSVICGSVGLFEVNHVLNDEEVKGYKTKGESFIEELARKITQSPWDYLKR